MPTPVFYTPDNHAPQERDMTAEPSDSPMAEATVRAVLEKLGPLPKCERVYADGEFVYRYTGNQLTAERERAVRATVAAMEAGRADMEARKDAAYLERNQCVSLIARMAVAMGLPVSVTKTAIEGWSEDWHGCIYIGLPTGQVSWHFHDSQAHLFAGLPARGEAWDGHDTPEKYRRVAEAFATPPAPAPAPAAPQVAQAESVLSAMQSAITHSHADHGRRSVNMQSWGRLVDAVAALSAEAQPARVAVGLTDELLADVLTTAHGTPEWHMDDVRAGRAVERASWAANNLTPPEEA